MSGRVLVGYLPDERGDDALELARLVADADGSPLTVACIYPPPWPVPGPGRVDAEWLGHVRGYARSAVEQARDRDAGRMPAERVRTATGAHRGSGRGLIETAEREGADLIVIGSAPGGPAGRIVIGSTADQLLHGSPVPVLMAPRGYAAGPPARLSGLTVAHRPSRGSELGLAAALRLARRLDVPIRLLTLLERPSWLSGVLRGEEIMRRQREYAVRDLQAAAELLSGHTQVTTQVAEGDGIEGAVRNCHWPPGELLACMSGSHGPLRQVFLGGVSGKIVRAAPCPVALLPGTAGRAGGAA